MQKIWSKNHQKYIGITLLMIVMGIFRGMEKPNGYLFDIEFIINFIINTALLLAWIISIYIRIIHKKIRFYLISVGALMFFWLFVRTIKYRVLSVYEGMNLLWYLFYIPIVLIPLFSYYTAQTVGQKEDSKLPLRDKLFLIPAILIILGVLTNDIHRMAFVFEGNTYAGMTYGYGLFYYLSYLFSFSFAIASIYIMFRKSRIPASKERVYLPFIFVIIYVFYSIFYSLNQNHRFLQFIEITIAYCMTTIAFWESCIQIGLIGSNSKYNEFFRYSTRNTGIVDKDGKTHYYSGQENIIDAKTFEQLKTDSMISRNIKSRLYISPITGGYVIWEENLDNLLGLIEKLETVNSKLENEIQLIQNQMNIDEKRIMMQEKNRLYDVINKKTNRQMNKIKLNLEYIRQQGNEELKWREISIYATYIKRYSNLVFLAESQDRISGEDLEITIKESLNNLKKMGVNVGLKMDSGGGIKKEQAFAIYECIQDLIEVFFRELKNIFLSIREEENYLNLSVLLNGNGINRFIEADILLKIGGKTALFSEIYEEDRDNVQINLRIL